MAGAKLTKRRLDEWATAGTEEAIWDGELKGFGALRRAGGSISFVFTYRAPPGGRAAPKRKMILGRYSEGFTLDMARTKAREAMGEIAKGIDPTLTKREQREGLSKSDSVAAAVARYVEKYAKPNQKSWRETERILLKDVVPHLGDKRISATTKGDVVRMLDKLEQTGPVRARHALAWTRGLFSWLKQRGEMEANPCEGLSLPPPTARERVLSDGEIVAVLRGAAKVGWPWGSFARVLLLTGQRRGEIAGLRWDEVSEGNLCLPAERTKNGRAHTIPLPTAVADLLAAAPRYADSPFVFTTIGTAPISGFSKGKVVLDKAVTDLKGAPLENWTWHDLRRTAASGMAGLGIAPHTIERLLHHEMSGLSRVATVYNRHSYLPEMAAALALWQAELARLENGAELPGNVVPIRA